VVWVARRTMPGRNGLIALRVIPTTVGIPTFGQARDIEIVVSAMPQDSVDTRRWEATMTSPADQYWVINGQVILDVMYRCHDGADPELMYLELIANSDTEDVENQQS